MIGRLRYRDDFQALRRDGRTVRRDFLQVVYRPADDPPTGVRVAFAIGHPVGIAVVRNRIRRRLRSLMNELATQGSGLPAGDYLIRVNRSGAEADSSELCKNLSSALAALWEEREDNG